MVFNAEAKQAASAMGLRPSSAKAAAQVTEAGARAAIHSADMLADMILVLSESFTENIATGGSLCVHQALG